MNQNHGSSEGVGALLPLPDGFGSAETATSPGVRRTKSRRRKSRASISPVVPAGIEAGDRRGEALAGIEGGAWGGELASHLGIPGDLQAEPMCTGVN